MAQRREAKSAKRNFVYKIKIGDILTRSFASLSHFNQIQVKNKLELFSGMLNAYLHFIADRIHNFRFLFI